MDLRKLRILRWGAYPGLSVWVQYRQGFLQEVDRGSLTTDRGQSDVTEAERENWRYSLAGFGDRGRGHEPWNARDKGVKTGKGEESDFFPTPSGRDWPLDFSLVKLILDFRPQICKRINMSVSNSATQWTVACQILCPWDSPGKNTGVGCHALLQGIFSTQGSDLSLFYLLHWQAGSLPLVPPGKPMTVTEN